MNDITAEIEEVAGGSSSSVGTGGMKSKIEAVKISMASGIPTFLGNASTQNISVDAVSGKARGTYFIKETPSVYLDQKKKWIAFNSHPEGEITITQQAKKNIIEKQESLSITGIDRIEGPFEKEAVVRIIDTYRNEIGCGVVNFSANELTHLRKQISNRAEYPIVMDIDYFVCQLDVPISV